MLAPTICLGILALAATALGLFMLCLSIRAICSAGRARTWPAAIGKVDGSSLSATLAPHEARPGGVTLTYRPHIQYYYEVMGTTYSSAKFGFLDMGSSSESWAKQRLALIGARGVVTVYYDPANPSTAVLDRRLSLAMVGVGLGSFFFLGCPILIVKIWLVLSAKGHL